jgi:PAS domain S-box-containing protein
MILVSIRQIFRPLFGVERLETTSRFLYAILLSGIAIDLVMLVLRLLSGATFSNSTTLRVLTILFLFQSVLLFGVKRGYVTLAAQALVVGAWIGATYQIWSADGVRDVAIYIYILLILIAALLINWRFSLAVSIVSVISIWIFAFQEASGLRVAHIDSPFNTARDLTAIFILFVLLLYLVIKTLSHSLDAVYQSEEKFRRIFHVSPVAIAIASLEEGLLIDANQAYWKLTGLEPTLSIGKTTVELGIWSSYAERQKFVSQLKERKSLYHPAYKIKSASDEERTTLAFYELIDVESNPALLAMFHDITEQKNSQLALEASEQRYRQFVEQSMEGIWFLAFDQPISIHLPAEEQVKLIYQTGYVSDSNDVLAQMYGYKSSAEIKGVRLLDLQESGELSDVNYQATLKLVKEGYRSGNRETREQTRDGKIAYFLNNAIGVVENDCLVGLWGTQLDITVLKNTEDALRLSEARTRALLDAIPDMIFEFKKDGTILQYISSEMNRPLLPPEQFLGRRITDVLPAAVANQTLFAIDRVLDSGQVHAFEYQLLQNDENKTFEARITPLSTDTVLAIVRDVSLQKWILGEREKLISDLELKNAELERFSYTASHDLKSPLITIKGFLGFLREDAKRGNVKRLEADIQRISNAADKMQRLLNDLLELSRIGRSVNQPESIDVNDMIAEVVELLHGRLQGGAVAIRVSVEENLPHVYGDRARLLEVWQNLIDNAAKFMGSQPDPQIEIGRAGTARDGLPIFFVRDNGMGIDPRFRDRIFGLFNKLDARSEGTGIGLALIKRIIEFHGGRIWVESELGQGSTFYFTLPLQDSQGKSH